MEAHSKLLVPTPNMQGFGSVSPSGYIDGPSVLKGSRSFALYPEQNADTFTEAFKKSEYKSLRELVLKTYTPEPGANKECGVSALQGTPQKVPDYVEWRTIDSSHHGPCEVWCDDQLAYHNDNCLKAFPTGPHRLPYDKQKCVGAKRLQAIWLAVHFAQWQVYINCATLDGAGLPAAPTDAPAADAAGGKADGKASDGKPADATPAPPADGKPSSPASPATSAPAAPGWGARPSRGGAGGWGASGGTGGGWQDWYRRYIGQYSKQGGQWPTPPAPPARKLRQ